MKEAQTLGALVVLDTAAVQTYEGLEGSARQVIDSIAELLTQNDSRQTLDLLVIQGVVRPEIAKILGPKILEVFALVRRQLLAAITIESSNPLHAGVVDNAKNELVKGLLSLQPSLGTILGLSEAMIHKLAIMVQLLEVTDLTGTPSEHLTEGLGAVKEMVSNSERLVAEMVLRIVHGFKESRVDGITKVDTKVECKSANGVIEVGVQVGFDGELKDLKIFAGELFPGTELGIEFTGYYELLGGGATRKTDHGGFDGTLKFTYNILGKK